MSSAKKPKRERSRFDSSTAMDQGLLRTFSTLAKALSQSPSLEMILTTTLEQTLTDPRLDAGEIYLLDEKSSELNYIFHRGLSHECVQEAEEAPLRLDEGITGHVAAQKEPILVLELSQEPRFFREMPKKEGYRALVSLPIKSGDNVYGVVNLFSKEGQRFSARYVARLAASMEMVGITFEHVPLSEEKKARVKEPRESEERYRQLIEDINDGYIVIDTQEGRILFANGKAAEMLAYNIEELVGMAAHKLASPQLVADARELRRTISLGGPLPERYEVQAVRKDGSRIPVEVSMKALDYEGKPAASIIIRDITERKRAEIQLHPTRAVELLRLLGFLNGVLPIVESHHERYNGGGYPESRRGEETPLGARILAVADAYDAMTSARPYRPPMGHEEVIEVLKEGAGKQWDPKVIEAFLHTFDK